MGWTYTWTPASVVSLIPALGWAAAGNLDQTFGIAGKVTTTFDATSYARALVLQPDGKLVAAGAAWNGSDSEFALARYDTDGTLDASFGVDGRVTTNVSAGGSYASALVLQPDGKLVAAGAAWNGYSNGNNFDFALARYNPNGSLDASFGTGGTVTTASETAGGYGSSILALAMQADGKLVAAGVTDPGFGFDFALARYNVDGALDTTFGVDGKVTTDFGGGDGVSGLAVQPDGKLVAAGGTIDSPDGDFAIARYNSNGRLDASFGTNGKVTTDIGTPHDQASAVVVQKNRNLVVAGSGSGSGGQVDDFALARYEGDFVSVCGNGGLRVGVVPTKLIVVDKLEMAGKAKAVFVAKDAAVRKGAGTDPADIAITFDVAYENGLAYGRFVLPKGDEGWVANKTSKVKFVNKLAPDGTTQARVGVIEPGKRATLVGKGLGETPFNILSAGDPAGYVQTAYCVENGGEETCHCSTFTGCTYKLIARGRGAKVTCKTGRGDSACEAICHLTNR